MKKYALFFFIIFLIFLTGCSSTKPVDSDKQEEAIINNSSENQASQAQNSRATPVLIKGFFVGGLVNGKWMEYDDFFNSKIIELEGFEYDVYMQDRKTGTAKGHRPHDNISGEILKGDIYDEGFSFVGLFGANNQQIDYDIAIKADWDLFPRQYKKQNTDNETYKNIINEALKNEGLENSFIKAKQIIRVDLEGDGTEEVIITADNISENGFELVKKGDGAIIIFRKIVNGEVQQQIIDKDLILEQPEYDSGFRYLFHIESIADLDGDGAMEIIVKEWYYEGEDWCVYKLVDNNLELVTKNGWGA